MKNSIVNAQRPEQTMHNKQITACPLNTRSQKCRAGLAEIPFLSCLLC